MDKQQRKANAKLNEAQKAVANRKVIKPKNLAEISKPEKQESSIPIGFAILTENVYYQNVFIRKGSLVQYQKVKTAVVEIKSGAGVQAHCFDNVLKHVISGRKIFNTIYTE